MFERDLIQYVDTSDILITLRAEITTARTIHTQIYNHCRTRRCSCCVVMLINTTTLSSYRIRRISHGRYISSVSLFRTIFFFSGFFGAGGTTFALGTTGVAFLNSLNNSARYVVTAFSSGLGPSSKSSASRRAGRLNPSYIRRTHAQSRSIRRKFSYLLHVH